jgi:hypothetical protein
MLRAVIAMFVMACAVRAGSISITQFATVAVSVPFPPGLDCPTAFSFSASYVSNSCGDGGATADDGGPDPGNLLGSITETGGIETGLLPGHTTAISFGLAGADVTETELLDASGSTGSGLLQLEFLLNGYSENDGATGGGGYVADFSFMGSGFSYFGSGLCPTDSSGQFLCGGYPDTEGTPVFVTVGFVFGTPFSVTQDLEVEVGSSGSGFANFDVQSVLASYSVTNQNGLPIAPLTVEKGLCAGDALVSAIG